MGTFMAMPASRKTQKRPCSHCRRWFQLNPRTVKCQKTCGPACSKAWEARRQAEWRRKNPDYAVYRRMRPKLDQATKPGAVVEVGPVSSPEARLPWRLVQTAFGAEKAVVLAFALRLQPRQRQTAFRVKVRFPQRSPGRLPPSAAQTAIASGP